MSLLASHVGAFVLEVQSFKLHWKVLGVIVLDQLGNVEGLLVLGPGLWRHLVDEVLKLLVDKVLVLTSLLVDHELSILLARVERLMLHLLRNFSAPLLTWGLFLWCLLFGLLLHLFR